MPLPKILIVEDDESLQRVLGISLQDDAVPLRAFTVAEGERLFREHPDIAAVYMDGQVPGPSTTPELVRLIRQTFAGPMFATSSCPDYRQRLIAAGCDRQCEKHQFSKRVLEVLGARGGS